MQGVRRFWPVFLVLVGACDLVDFDGGVGESDASPPLSPDGGQPTPSATLPFAALPWLVEAPGAITTVSFQPDSGAPQVWTDHLTYAGQAPVLASYTGLAGLADDWIGIAQVGASPGNVVKGVYTGGVTSGSHVFPGLPSGKYVAQVYSGCTLCVVAQSQPFQVGVSVPPAVATDKQWYTVGETVSVLYSGLPGGWTDFISFASPGEPPHDHSPTLGVAIYGKVDGTEEFSAIPIGTYVARAFHYVDQDDYELVAESVPFTVDAVPDPACQDGHRDPGEECDDGNALDSDLCSATCLVLDELVGSVTSASDAGALAPGRTLGLGRHPLAVGDSGMAAVFVSLNGPAPKLGMRILGRRGETNLGAFESEEIAPFEADPVVAALPGGRYAVAWTAADDGDERGVRLATLSPEMSGPPMMLFANTQTDFAQHSPDLLWTGSQLVAAWVDDASLDTGPDIKFRLFGSDGQPLSGEQALAETEEAEGRVALATFGTGWAAAWRAGNGETETLHVKASTGTTWTIGPYPPGPDDDRPALVEIGGGQLLVVFTEGTDPGDGGLNSVYRLRAAVCHGDNTNSVETITLSGGNDPIPDNDVQSQTHPAAAFAGGKVYIAWRTYLQQGDPDHDEVWVKEITPPSSGGEPLMLDYSLPRQAIHRAGDQRRPALAAASLPGMTNNVVPTPAIFAAWDDYGQNLDPQQGKQDVVLELFAAPILRLPAGEGQP